MDDCPISALLSSLDPSRVVQVTASHKERFAHSSAIEDWTVTKLREHFRTNSHPPVLCSYDSWSALLEDDARWNGRQALQEVRSDDLVFKRKHILAQKAAVEGPFVANFRTSLSVEHGKVHIMTVPRTDPLEHSVRPYSGKCRTPIAARDAVGKNWQHAILEAGNTLKIPANTWFAIRYLRNCKIVHKCWIPAWQDCDWQERRKAICNTCSAIPFDRLPCEQDPGHPHLASLQELVVSGERCSLCHYILKSIGASKRDLRGETFDIPQTARNDVLGQNVTAFSCDKPFEAVYDFSPSSTVGSHIVRLRSSLFCPLPELSSEWGYGPRGHSLAQFDAQTTREDQTTDNNTTGRPWLYGNWWMVPCSLGALHQLIGIGARLTRRPGKITLPGQPNTKATLLRGSDVRLITEKFSSLPMVVPATTITADSFSSTGIKAIKYFIAKCNGHHHEPIPTDTVMPTRVLDLRGVARERVVRLLDTAGMKGRYVALSHCWGTSDMLKTTSATLQSHRAGIPLSVLPGSFQKAIFVCQQLGVQFLWIDSLCIIQGDSEDWLRESARMYDIYSGSWLTIGSPAFDHGTAKSPAAQEMPNYTPYDCLSTGFKEVRSFDVKMLSRCSVTQPAVLYFSPEWMPPSLKLDPRHYNNGCFGERIDFLADEPLSQRGWTLQERVLSPRMIHFGRDQMVFECESYTLAEDGSRDENIYSKTQLLRYKTSSPSSCSKGFDFLKRQGLPPTEAAVRSSARLKSGWPFLVEQYSRRKLTFEKDKLPALSGLSKMFARETGDEYLAGLWRQHIFDDLLWRIDPYLEETDPCCCACVRRLNHGNNRYLGGPRSVHTLPSAYRAPTWSWASLDGSVKFLHSQNQTVQAEVIDCFVKPAGSDVFGAVETGWLTLKLSNFCNNTQSSQVEQES